MSSEVIFMDKQEKRMVFILAVVAVLSCLTGLLSKFTDFGHNNEFATPIQSAFQNLALA
jgi:hypothetical protein